MTDYQDTGINWDKYDRHIRHIADGVAHKCGCPLEFPEGTLRGLFKRYG